MKAVSIIIPCLNEAKYIENTVLSLAAQDYPLEDIEILIVDGGSDDGTLEILSQLTPKYSFLRILHNAKKTAPFALNLAIKEAVGSIIIRMDAHCKYPSNYVSLLVDQKSILKADNIGLCLQTTPANNSLMAKSIALCLSHPFGVGNALFRTGLTAPQKVDTVPFGCYSKSLFDRIGFFNTDLTRGEDNEFNSRIIDDGGQIFLIPGPKIEYFPRENFKKTAKMYFQYGFCRPFINRLLKKPANLRQFVPLIFLASLLLTALFSLVEPRSTYLFLITLTAHSLINLAFSLKIASRAKSSGLIPYLFFGFLLIHLSYGYGSLSAYLRLPFTSKNDPLKHVRNLGLSR